MIRGMVDKLQARMDADGSDVEGWLRLAQSRAVLGETDRARATFEQALKLHPDDPALLKGYGRHPARAGPRRHRPAGDRRPADRAVHQGRQPAARRPRALVVSGHPGAAGRPQGRGPEAPGRRCWRASTRPAANTRTSRAGSTASAAERRATDGAAPDRRLRLRHDRQATRTSPTSTGRWAGSRRWAPATPSSQLFARRPHRRRADAARAAPPAGAALRPPPPALHRARHAQPSTSWTRPTSTTTRRSAGPTWSWPPRSAPP